MSIQRDGLWPFVVIGLIGAMLIAFSTGPEMANAGDKDCGDFKTQKKAQKFFKKHNPRKDSHGLDADGDGIACETNRCPCKKKPAFRSGPEVTERRNSCQYIKLGERRVFYKSRMDCRTAKTYARRLYRTKGGSHPKNFRCFTGSKYQQGANCRHKNNSNRFFGWHPLD